MSFIFRWKPSVMPLFLVTITSIPATLADFERILAIYGNLLLNLTHMPSGTGYSFQPSIFFASPKDFPPSSRDRPPGPVFALDLWDWFGLIAPHFTWGGIICDERIA